MNYINCVIYEGWRLYCGISSDYRRRDRGLGIEGCGGASVAPTSAGWFYFLSFFVVADFTLHINHYTSQFSPKSTRGAESSAKGPEIGPESPLPDFVRPQSPHS